jgi:hypothetical protein
MWPARKAASEGIVGHCIVGGYWLVILETEKAATYAASLNHSIA